MIHTTVKNTILGNGSVHPGVDKLKRGVRLFQCRSRPPVVWEARWEWHGVDLDVAALGRGEETRDEHIFLDSEEETYEGVMNRRRHAAEPKCGVFLVVVVLVWKPSSLKLIVIGRGFT